MIKPSIPENTQLLIFTDLDGTLLDHHSYSFAPAMQALQTIAERGIPLIINSSKTFAEIVPIQRALNICQPFICENGAAAFRPGEAGLSDTPADWQQQAFAVDRQQVLATLSALRAEYSYQFTGFADVDTQGIVEMTGLDVTAAGQAGQRNFSEPLLWQGSDDEKKQFLQQLERHHLSAQQGGRFLTVMGDTAHKGLAMDAFVQQYSDSRPVVTIALGDSPNDQPMLDAADIAVVIKSGRSDAINLQRPQQIIRTELTGPAGWQSAMQQLLAALQNNNESGE